jgi:hypothetical protein
MADFALLPGSSPLHRLELAGPERRRATIALYEHASHVAIDARVTNDRAAGDPWQVEAATHIRLSLASPVSCTRDGSSRAWDLLSGPAHDLGPFRDLVWWIEHHLQDLESPAPTRAVIALCDLATRSAVASCDPETRALALRFAPASRFFVYAAVLNDTTGRVRQITNSCPALLIYASYFGVADARTKCLLAAIKDGRRMPHLLGIVAPDNTLARTLLRRAPSSLEVTDLERISRAPGIDANDIPRSDDDAVLRWYRAMSRWGSVSSYVPDRSSATRMGGFFSRHGVADLGPESIVDWVVEGGGQPPCRRSSIAIVQRAVARWHASLHDLTHDPSTSFPSPPRPSQVDHRLDLRAIRSVGELLDEGRTMHHCVGAFTPQAIAGALVFFRGTIDDRRSTVCVERTGSGWHLREVAGFANERFSDPVIRIVEHWARQLGGDDGVAKD